MGGFVVLFLAIDLWLNCTTLSTLYTMSDSGERVVIRYWDRTEARVGDTVNIDATQQGIVRDVVDTQEKLRTWGLDEFGLMFDRVFYPERCSREFPIELVSRAVT